MFKKIMLTAAVVVTALGSVDSASARKIQVAVGPKISTLGLGLEATAKLHKNWRLRAGVNWLGLDMGNLAGAEKVDGSGFKEDFDMRFLTAGAFVDFHPFANGFKVSVGGMYNGNKFESTRKPTSNITHNGVTYTPDQIGKTTRTVDFRKFAPYAGIGYDSAFTNSGNWSFTFDVGVLFQGSPRGSAKSSGAFAAVADLQDRIAKDAAKMLDKTFVRYYPVVSLGFKYRF